jgi:hypothetical protein
MTDSFISQFTCHKCECVFASRNKLFKHVRDVHTAPPSPTSSPPDDVSPSLKLEPPPAVASEHCCSLSELPPHFVYVLGGRLRGRTLNAVQRFSSRRQVWEDCPAGRMLENRGSHGAATVDEVVFVVGKRMFLCVYSVVIDVVVYQSWCVVSCLFVCLFV